MTKVGYFSLAGGLATILALALIKRKPSMKRIPVETTSTVLDEGGAAVSAALPFFRAATPVSSGKTYYPAANDLGSIVMKRLNPNTDKSGKLLPGKLPQDTSMFYAEVAKLNGTLNTLNDISKVIKDKKALKLPTTAIDKGKEQFANGDVK